MIGKKIPTTDGSFKVEVTTNELEKLQPSTSTDLFNKWMADIPHTEPKETADITIYNLDENDNVTQVTELYGVKHTAKLYVNDQEYKLPLDMAIAALKSHAATDIILGNDNTIVDDIEVTYKINDRRLDG